MVDFARGGPAAITPPPNLAEMPDEACVAFGEAGSWKNIMTPDAEVQAKRVGIVRAMLRKAQLENFRRLHARAADAAASGRPRAGSQASRMDGDAR